MAYRFTPADRGAFKRCRRQWDFGARERQGYEPARPAPALDLDLAVRDALAVYYFPGMWDWQRSVVLPLVLQGLARSMGRQPGSGTRSSPDSWATSSSVRVASSQVASSPTYFSGSLVESSR